MAKLRQILLGNLWLKILSVVIATFIWVMVSEVNDPVKTVLFTNIPITIINQDSVAQIGKVVEPEGSGTVTIKVTALKSILKKLAKNGSDFYVEADLENMNAMNSVPLTVTCTNQAVTWDQIQLSPSTLKVILEDKVEQTYVPVVQAEGTPAGGFEVGKTSLPNGKNIVIAGPKSLMDIINIVYAPVNVENLGHDRTVQSKLRVYDKNGAVFTETQMSSLEFKDENGRVIPNHTIDVSVDMWRVKTDVPIVIETSGTPAWGYRVSDINTIPKTISVCGTDAALALMGAEANPIDTINVEGATENVTGEIDLNNTLVQYSDLRLITGADPMVQVEVVIEATGDSTIKIPLSTISFTSKPENMNLVFTPADEVSVKVHALSAGAPKLLADQLSLSADLAICENEGSYEIPVSVALPEGYELGDPVFITVVSTKQAAQEPAAAPAPAEE